MDVPKPPEDLEIRNIIDKLAQFVARNGPQFEQMTMNKQSGNPKFHFLFGGEHHAYYRFRVASERNSTEMMNTNSPMTPMPFPPPPMVNHSFGPPLPPQQSFHPRTQGPPPQNHPQHFMSPNDNGFHPLHHHHHHHHTPQQQQPQHHHHHVPPFVEESFHPNNSQFLHPPPILPPPHHLQAQHHHQPPQQPQHKPSSMTTGLIAPPPMQQQPMLTNFNNWNPNGPSTPSFDNTVDSSKNANTTANIESQITQIQDHLKESEKNLSAQHDVIMGKEKEQRIENLITKLLDDELKRMCEDYNINLNEFDKILQPIIETCRKESIANGKVWIFNNCTVSEHYDAVAKHLLKRVANMDCQFGGKIHLMYLINDIFNHCMRKHDDKLKAAILKIIVPAFSLVMMEANEEHKQKINKLLKLWEMNQYLDQALLDQLKTPKESLDSYKTSLHQLYAEQIQTIEKEQTEKYAKTQKQHEDFVAECQTKIQQLQQQKQFLQTNVPTIRPPFPPPNVGNMFGPSIPPGQGGGGGPMPPLPPHQMLPVPGVNPPTSLPYSSQPGNFVGNPMVTLNNMNPATVQPPPPVHLQRPPFQPHFQSSHPPPHAGFFPNNPGQQIYPPNSSAPINMPIMNLPSTGPGPLMHGTGPTLPPPPPQLLSQMIPPLVNPEETIPTPYFERPAGIMTQLIRLEDFDYNSIDPKEIKMPPLLPPSERLLQALEEFYALPARNRPRNNEGWEKLGLHEFFKAKSQARKEYENKFYGNEQPPPKDSNDVYNDTDSSNMQTFSDRQNNDNNSTDAKKNSDQNYGSDAKSSPKRYKEFREDKSPENRSRSKSIEKHKSSRTKRSRSISSDSRSRSRSPRASHRSKDSTSSSTKKHSRRKSPSSSPEPRKFHSHKDDKKSIKNHSNDSKKSDATKTMTWSSSTGFKIKEKNPIASNSPASNHSTTPSTDIYQGFGSQPSVPNVADPFESFRRNKGQAYIQRIREGRRD